MELSQQTQCAHLEFRIGGGFIDLLQTVKELSIAVLCGQWPRAVCPRVASTEPGSARNLGAISLAWGKDGGVFAVIAEKSEEFDAQAAGVGRI